MIKVGIIFLFIFLLPNISAVCNENQIDINSASAEELDSLNGIGVVKAQAIIQIRPFGNLDDLLNVNGIGNVTLNKIKMQELACVDEIKIAEKNTTEIVNLELTNNPVEITNNAVESTPLDNVKEADKISEIMNLTPISLNAQNIKSENNKETLKRNLSFYGLIAICAVFGALFLLKNRKRKNEFN